MVSATVEQVGETGSCHRHAVLPRDSPTKGQAAAEHEKCLKQGVCRLNAADGGPDWKSRGTCVVLRMGCLLGQSAPCRVPKEGFELRQQPRLGRDVCSNPEDGGDQPCFPFPGCPPREEILLSSSLGTC